jgi:hypothetical protein
MHLTPRIIEQNLKGYLTGLYNALPTEGEKTEFMQNIGPTFGLTVNNPPTIIKIKGTTIDKDQLNEALKAFYSKNPYPEYNKQNRGFYGGFNKTIKNKKKIITRKYKNFLRRLIKNKYSRKVKSIF